MLSKLAGQLTDVVDSVSSGIKKLDRLDSAFLKVLVWRKTFV
jgi:hypothetical protein